MAKFAPITELPRKPWPGWAKGLVSVAILWQLASLFAAELAQQPSSPLELEIARPFHGWYELTGQGVAHRFYTDIGPTPILMAELRFGDGRPPKTVRIPDRSTRPRMVYQRQLALANAVYEEFMPAFFDASVRIDSRWARSIAYYLAKREPGCSGVTIRLLMHNNPSPGQLIETIQTTKTGTIDPDAPEFYDLPRLIGDYPWPKP